jgi:SAM-dependent methyltransferase
MHKGDEIWWEYCRDKYPKSFTNCSVIEIGSYDINGTVRKYFTNCPDYIGIDWREGPSVDIVVLAHEMRFDRQFDTIISSNTLEHDPYWNASLRVMCEYLKPGGMLLMSWGGPNSAKHREEHSPVGDYHPKSLDDVEGCITKYGLKIVESLSSKDFLKRVGSTENDQGVLNLVAVKDGESI